MKILVIGSGGREHALVWKIAQSRLVKKIFCAPGNGGIAQIAECVDIKADDIGSLTAFAGKEKVTLTVVGPEAPLAAGIVDEFTERRLRVFGPAKKAAQLEGSKVFAKQLMAKYKVPTAAFEVFDDPDAALRFIDKKGAPCVVKADGLAAGKGVVVATTADEAKSAVRLMMQEKAFGGAGSRVIIEDCLQGEEASILVLTDGKTVVPLASSQDHKRIFDNDQGPNTGGMGAYSPAPCVTGAIFQEILETIVHRTIDGLAREGIVYRGVLYAGVMLTAGGPATLEFNVRFGDPETQAILPRLQSDLVEVMLAATEGNLSRYRELSWDTRPCVCVVVASGGYPGDYQQGNEIDGLEAVAGMKGVVVFHAGTKKRAAAGPQPSAVYVTNGGRVLGVTALGATIKEAQQAAYSAAGKIHFEGMHYRHDIGQRALRSAGGTA